MPHGSFHFADIGGVRCSIDQDVGTCPLCHRAVHAEQIAWTLSPPSEREHPTLEIVYECPHRECGRLFIGYFRHVSGHDYRMLPTGRFQLRASAPWTQKEPDVPKEVIAISPAFVEVYGQAASAETYSLHQVAGPGYRKALEFLIKDYSVSLRPEMAEEIKALPLARVIADYADDANVRACAERAAWLGNDETHYVRRWEDKDIDDLKTLLQLSMNWIHNHALTKKYMKDMPTKGK